MKLMRYKLMFILLSIMLTACTSDEDRRRERQAIMTTQLTEQVQQTETQLNSLKKQINSGLVKNAVLLKLYGEAVKRYKPELAELIDALTKDATSNGPIFQSLMLRFKEAQAGMSIAVGSESGLNNMIQEMVLIDEAANPAVYNMILTDPINVLADMSDGKLGRVEAMSKEAMKIL